MKSYAKCTQSSPHSCIEVYMLSCYNLVQRSTFILYNWKQHTTIFQNSKYKARLQIQCLFLFFSLILFPLFIIYECSLDNSTIGNIAAFFYHFSVLQIPRFPCPTKICLIKRNCKYLVALLLYCKIYILQLFLQSKQDNSWILGWPSQFQNKSYFGTSLGE